jgi:hypothetical protein
VEGCEVAVLGASLKAEQDTNTIHIAIK